MFSGTIDRCFDSHLHWHATGEMALRLNLFDLKRPEDILLVELKAYHFNEDWLIGFGWDQNRWNLLSGEGYPTRKILDQLCPDRPVALSRVDGHALWVNTLALKRAGLLNDQEKLTQPLPQVEGGRFITDAEGIPTGILIDVAKMWVEKIIPSLSAAQMRHFLLRGASLLNQAGFTHVRDLSCSELQWNEACRLDEAGLLTLAVDQYFAAEDPREFDAAFKLAVYARAHSTPHLRPLGLKVYLDGALGSEGAWISHNYLSGTGHGLQLLSLSEFEEQMRRAFAAGFDLAVHAIGDEAAHQAMKTAHRVWAKGLRGFLHIEHAELLRPETIALMKDQTVVCHLQPCHWLSDSKWLQTKIGNLSKFAFQWRALEEAEVPFDFGSDSPIEKSSFLQNLEALKLSAEAGIPEMTKSPIARFSHPDSSFGSNSFTVFKKGLPLEVVFEGRHLLAEVGN